MPKYGTYLGIDFGTKRIGLAVGQSITLTATPLITLKADDITRLSEIIKEWEPQGLIVGLALQPDGSHSQTSLIAKKWGIELKKRYDLPVYFIEERLSSVAAREKYPDTDKDAGAAAIILEGWLNAKEDEHVSI